MGLSSSLCLLLPSRLAWSVWPLLLLLGPDIFFLNCVKLRKESVESESGAIVRNFLAIALMLSVYNIDY